MYANYIDHPTFGRLWYRAHLRNHFRMSYTAEANRELGARVEIHLPGYLVVCSGADLEAAETKLRALLDWYVLDGDTLPTWTWRDVVRYWGRVLAGRVRHPLRSYHLWSYSRKLQRQEVRMP